MSTHAELKTDDTGYACLAGGGEMGAYMRSFAWSETVLGPVHGWPQSLRTSVSTCLNSRFAILIWWGPEMVMLYNDAYRDIIAGKHPAALGHPGRECWPEIWDIIGPMLEGVMQRGEATWSNDLLLLLERNGYPEECYFTFSYSPIRDESGGIGGIFTPVADTTDRVIGERRLKTLRDLAIRAGRARDVRAACGAAAETLAANPHDIPFAALYLFDEQRSSATLVGTAGVTPGSRLAPSLWELSDMPAQLSEAARGSGIVAIDDLDAILGPLPGGAWGAASRSGVVLPIIVPGQTASIGYILAGVSARKRLNTAYRTLFELIGGHISTAIAEANAHEEERRRAEALAEIDRAKTAFFSNVSHEFRTPLTLMLGPLEAMLAQADPTVNVTREELDLVHRNGIRLLKLVNTLLDFSRIEAGRVEAAYEPVDIGAVTRDIASSFRSAMERAGLIFTVQCDAVAGQVYVDRDMWEKIVLNLVSNAFKFTLEGGVVVAIEDCGNRVALSVSDTGTGIPEKELPRVFERFHRIDGARGRTHEGTGIGLALVHELVKLHGGSTSVHSEVGKGTTFVISIPKGCSHLPAHQVRPERTVNSASTASSAYVDEALRWLPDAEQPSGVSMPFAADSVAAPHSQFTGRILLSDDNADMRAYVRRLLGPHYEVEAVVNGLDAVAALRRNPPDLVLTDVMMPGLDGFGLLREIRAAESTSTIPVILLSARAGEDARIEGLQAGADDYLVKPFTARELLARVGAHLAMSRLRKDAAERERILRTEAEAAHERTSSVLESISDAFAAIDAGWRFTYVNAEAERSVGMKREEMIGKVVWDLFPGICGTELETVYRRAMSDRVLCRLEHYFPEWRKWFDIRVNPARDGGVSVFYRDVTQRKRTEEEIRRTNEALRAANGDLEQFAYSASHDLKEPLRMVRAYCQLLSRKYSGKLGPDADEIINYCVDGAGRMSALLDDLLAYMKASSKSDEVTEAAPLDLMLDTALLNLKSAIEETGAVITRDPLPDLCVAPIHGQQIFQNLISNALKYRSAAPPRVHVGARKEGSSWIFSVQDNGIGIAPKYQEQVFGLFKRLHTTAEYSGTGLGLAICKKLVESYEGRIWLESELGGGTTFFFTIPEKPSEVSPSL